MNPQKSYNEVSLAEPTRPLSKALYRARWVIKKIRSRDSGYITRRLGYSINKFFQDAVFPYRRYDNFGLREDVSQNPLEYFRRRQEPRFHFQREEIEEIVARVPEHVRHTTISDAEEIVAHRFTYQGIRPVELNPVDWEFDPPDSSAWLLTANRHFNFAKLGFAYWYTHDRRFFDTFLELSTSWIRAYIPKIGRIKWDHPFEVAARINAWIWAYFLFLHCPYWESGSHRYFLNGLGRLTGYLYRVIEYHNPGNHILLEAKALALCGGLFPEFKESQKWEKKAWKIIDQELKAQICPDGVHQERSTMYHRIVAGELGELLLFCRRNKLEKVELEGVVCKMSEFLAWIISGDGQMPTFGDAYCEDSYYRFWAPSIAGVVNKACDIPNVLAAGDQTEWALGTNLRFDHSAASESKWTTTLAKAFPQGGYFVSRWGWDSRASVLVWDCGPIGYEANPYHSHSDTLSFTLAIEGVPFIIDPGIEEVRGDINPRLKQTSAHNTVVVDGMDQSVLAPLNGLTEVWRPARPTLHLWASNADFDAMIGSHDGYERFARPIVHHRTVLSVRSRYWLFLDQLQGRGVHTFDQRFHLAPSTLVTLGRSHASLVLEREQVSVSLFPVRLTPQMSGQSAYEGVCVQEAVAEMIPDQLEPIQVVSIKLQSNAPLNMAVIVAPATSKIRGVELMETHLPGTEGFRIIEIRGDGLRDFACVAEDSRTTNPVLGEWATDAPLVLIRQKDMVAVDIYAIGATFLGPDPSPPEEQGTVFGVRHIQLPISCMVR